MPLRILHVITTLDAGGAENHLLMLCRGQKRLGADVSVAWLKGRGELAPEFEAAGCRAIRTDIDPLLPRRIVAAVARMVGVLRRLRPHVVHTHLNKAEVVGNTAARICRVPAVVSSKHNDDAFLVKPHFRLMHFGLSFGADAIIALSRHVEEYTRKIGVRPSVPIRTLHYGLDAETFARASDPDCSQKLREKFLVAVPMGKRKYLIGTAARLERQKGLQHLIEASALLGARRDDFATVILGEGTLRRELEQLVKDRGLEGRVHLPGRTRDMPSFMKALDVFCLPSLWEGFGLVLLEAMSCGVPVVATEVSAIPEVVADGSTGLLVPPADPKKLADAIGRLLDDAELRSRMAAAGEVRVRSAFGVERMVHETWRLYEEVLQNRGSRVQG